MAKGVNGALFVLLIISFITARIYKDDDSIIQYGSDRRSTILKYATAEVGTYESGGNNRGKVEKYYVEKGYSLGSPYCQLFVLWVLDRAEVLYPSGINGKVKSWDKHKHLRTKAVDSCNIVRYVWSHVGFVVGEDKNTIVTIEGNSTKDGKGGVWLQRRNKSKVSYYINTDEL